jgi:hypothetical protein
VDEVALKLGERREDSEYEPAGRRGGVHVAGQHLEPDPALLQIADKADDMGQRAADAIELPYNKSVAIPGDVERLGKAGTLGRPPRTDIVIDPLASSPFQCVALEIEVLLPGRYAHVADQHVRSLPCAST